jgi:hypothetical protein
MRALACWGIAITVWGASLTACDPGEDLTSDAAGGSGGGGSGGSGGTGGGGGRVPDARLPDAPAGTAYQWIAIFDDEKAPACTGSGPGADIDSVDLIRGGQTIGVGLRDSAVFSATRTGETVAPCDMCGAGACMHSGMAAASRAEGIPNAMYYMSMPDTGYISLNAGVLWLKIGQANGNNPAEEIKSGDTVVVREVDQVYLAENTSFAGCACVPEKYAVYAYVQRDVAATRVKLRATKYRMENVSACGGSLTPTSDVGCGTTDFSVP